MIDDTSTHGDQIDREVRLLIERCEERIGASFDVYPSLSDLRRILGPAAQLERGYSDEDLAVALERGALVLAVVNSGAMRDDPSSFGTGEFDNAIWVCAVHRDVQTQEIAAYVTVDPRTFEPTSVPANRFLVSWLGTGGHFIAVDP